MVKLKVKGTDLLEIEWVARLVQQMVMLVLKGVDVGWDDEKFAGECVGYDVGLVVGDFVGWKGEGAIDGEYDGKWLGSLLVLSMELRWS